MTNSDFPAKPAAITLDTLPQLFAHHRAVFGGFSMEGPDTPPGTPPGTPPATPPERPEGVTEDEWNALSDPGRNALTRERDARQAAERALAASRAKPAPPKPPATPPAPTPPAPTPPAPTPPATPPAGDLPDFGALIQQAVEAAVKPFVEERETRQATEAAQKVQDTVLEAAKAVLLDETDALTNINLAAVVNDQGVADAAKVKEQLDDLVTRKPHLAKTTVRQAPPGIGGGLPASATVAEKVKAALADMQRATGARLPSSNS